MQCDRASIISEPLGSILRLTAPGEVVPGSAPGGEAEDFARLAEDFESALFNFRETAGGHPVIRDRYVTAWHGLASLLALEPTFSRGGYLYEPESGRIIRPCEGARLP